MSENRPPRMPANDQPLNAAPRKTVGPVVLAVLLLALVAVVFFAMFLLS